jgi:hypothetical protein
LGALARRQALRIDHDTFRTDCAALLHHVTRIVAEAGEQEVTDLARPSDHTGGIITAKTGADSSLGEEDRETEQEQARREQQAQEHTRQEHARQEQARQEQARQEPAWGELQAPTARTPPALPAWRDAEQSASGRGRNSPTRTLLGVLAVVAVVVAVFAVTLILRAGPDSAPPLADQYALVTKYYGLLPGNTDAAWALMSPAAQEAAGGRSGFDHFYGTIQSVSLTELRPSADSAVSATVWYVDKADPFPNEGGVSVPTRFIVGPGPDGRLLIQSFMRL